MSYGKNQSSNRNLDKINKLEIFQKSFNSTFNEQPTVLAPKDFELRFKLMKEENEEYLEAVENNDLVEVLDALTDQLYILCGTILEHGMQNIIEKCFEEVNGAESWM